MTPSYIPGASFSKACTPENFLAGVFSKSEKCSAPHAAGALGSTGFNFPIPQHLRSKVTGSHAGAFGRYAHSRVCCAAN